jgi:hypothetical protein
LQKRKDPALARQLPGQRRVSPDHFIDPADTFSIPSAQATAPFVRSHFVRKFV